MPRPVLMLEFNELSPELMHRFITEGHLPNFKRLRDESLVYVTDAAGADTFVAGNAVFSAKDPRGEIAALRDRCGVHV